MGAYQVLLIEVTGQQYGPAPALQGGSAYLFAWDPVLRKIHIGLRVGGAWPARISGASMLTGYFSSAVWCRFQSADTRQCQDDGCAAAEYADGGADRRAGQN